MRTNVAPNMLNFAPAGAREGFGPFLGVDLRARGFDPAATRIAMVPADASGPMATTPVGAAIALDASLIVATTTTLWLIVAMAFASSLAFVGLTAESIGHLEAGSGESDNRSTWHDVLGLVLCAGIAMLLQASGGAMRPFLAQARTAANSDPGLAARAWPAGMAAVSS